MTVCEGGSRGEGVILLHRIDDTMALERATSLGLVSEEGYLTPLGFQLVRRPRA